MTMRLRRSIRSAPATLRRLPAAERLDRAAARPAVAPGPGHPRLEHLAGVDRGPVDAGERDLEAAAPGGAGLPGVGADVEVEEPPVGRALDERPTQRRRRAPRAGHD